MNQASNFTHPLGQLYLNHLDVTVGPWIVGSWLDFLLNGILIIQFYNYFAVDRKDRLALRLLVILLAIFAVFKTATIATGVWRLCLGSIKNISVGPYLVQTDWVLLGQPLTTFVGDAATQAFFTARYYSLTKRWWFVVLIALGVAVEATSIALLTKSVVIVDLEGIQTWAICHWFSTLATDLLISSATCLYFYQKRSRTPNTSLNYLVGSLFTVTLQSALLPTIFTTLISIFAVSLQSYNVTAIALVLTMAKLNIISVLYTLNQRDVIKKAYIAYQEGGFRPAGSVTQVVGHAITSTSTDTNKRHSLENAPEPLDKERDLP